MSYYTEFYELLLKYWIAVIVPIGAWLNKKRKEYKSLVIRVEKLESKLDNLNETLAEDRIDRKVTSDKIDKIYEVVMQVKEDTAVNSAKINSVKDRV